MLSCPESKQKNIVAMKRRCRKGIPDCIRGFAWKKLLETNEEHLPEGFWEQYMNSLISQDGCQE